MNRSDENIAVEHLLPYRTSTLLVTDLLSYNPDQDIVCGLELRGDEHYFQGHFPDAPMLPGVLELEAMFQAACLWHALGGHVENTNGREDTPGLELSGVKSARFQHTIVPPQTLKITVRVENQTGEELLFFGSITGRNDENQPIYATASLLTTLSG